MGGIHLQEQRKTLDGWLKDFLQARDLPEADGRHLFAYHINLSEFQDLEKYLQGKMRAAACVCKSVWSYWGDNLHFCALFVLYASHWWQQNYDGRSFEWQPIMNALTCPADAWEAGQMGSPVTKGLLMWSLEPREQGYKYLGAIAREAGLPLKLLSENRGKIGQILRQVLREALRSGQRGEIIHSWVGSMKTQLPMSYRDDTVISLLSESVHIIIDEVGWKKRTP